MELKITSSYTKKTAIEDCVDSLNEKLGGQPFFLSCNDNITFPSCANKKLHNTLLALVHFVLYQTKSGYLRFGGDGGEIIISNKKAFLEALNNVPVLPTKSGIRQIKRVEIEFE